MKKLFTMKKKQIATNAHNLHTTHIHQTPDKN